MSWKDFTNQLRSFSHIALVGPLHHETFRPSDHPVIYVDGGVRLRPAPADLQRSFSVGDGDSDHIPVDHRLPAEKDFSDLAFVLRELPPSIVQVDLFGFLGGRKDHELANFGELHSFLKSRSAPTRAHLYTHGGLAVIAHSGGPFELRVHGLFSLFVIESSEVSLSGDCRYPLREGSRLSPFSSHGLSNEADGVVRVESRGPVFIFLSGVA